METKNDISARTQTAVYVGLMLLLGSTIALSYVPLGPFNFVIAFAIGAAKAALILFFYMQLKRSMPLMLIYAGVGVVWLLIASLLTFADYLTRFTPGAPFH